jgi:hypothetical protein
MLANRVAVSIHLRYIGGQAQIGDVFWLKAPNASFNLLS